MANARGGLWHLAYRKFKRDRWGRVALWVVALYAVIAIGVWLGIWGQGWSDIRGGMYDPISQEFWFGSNRNGQDIFQRTIFSTRTAFEVGLVVALASTFLGAIMGVVSGYWSGGWLDEIVLWLKGVLDSIPFYLFVAAVAFALGDQPYAMHVAMIATFWTTTARLVRGEVMKLSGLEFVDAARAIGVRPSVIMWRHVLPNTFHILLVQATIVFVAAIKTEVILSFLGLGVKQGVSWGLMISDATQDILAGQYYNFIFASLFLFVLVMAFNVLSDSLQDALDPKQVSV